MRQRSLEHKLMHREHFFTLCVVGLEFVNAAIEWM